MCVFVCISAGTYCVCERSSTGMSVRDGVADGRVAVLAVEHVVTIVPV